MTTKGNKPLIREKKDSSRKEINELRQENRQLRKKIGRLQKQIEKSLDTIVDDQEDDELPALPRTGIICPNCGMNGEIGSYKAPSGVILYGCKICKKFKKRSE